MRSDIQTATLSEISYDIAYGYTASATTDPVGPKFLRITDIQDGIVNWNDVPYCEIEEDKIDKYLLEDGDIVIARTGNSTGENYIFEGNEKSVFASYLIRYKIDRAKANPFFIAYQLRSNRWWSFVEGIKGGSAQAGANAKALGSFDCYLLDPELQDGVVTVLKSLDDKIELNRQINQTLEQIAQAIFKSWFVDFDPVKAKIRAKEQGRDPERAAMEAIAGKDVSQFVPAEQLATTAALFPDELVESELGLIPKGWVVSNIGKEMGQSPPGHTYNESGEGTQFFQGRRDFGWRYPINRVYCTAPQRMAKVGDTLLSVRAPVGDVNKATSNCCIGRGLAALQHKSGCEAYTYYMIKRLEQHFNSFDTEGTVFGSINQKNLKEINIVKADDNIVGMFTNVVGKIDEQILAFDNQNSTLSHIRDSLLPKLLSGEIELKETDPKAEATA